MNKDKIIQGYEWEDFFSLFVEQFNECDEDHDLRLSLEEGTKCIKTGDKFKNMMLFSTQWIQDSDKLLTRIFNSFDLNRDGYLNLFDYVTLRNYNNAYDILLTKESKVFYKNFEVGLHIVSRNLKFYDHEDFVRIFNRTIGYTYFPSEEYLDFASFSTIGLLLKLFINTNYHTAGYLTYVDLLSVGQNIQTYKLLQNYTQLFIKNDIIFESLNKGIKINNLIFIDKYNNTNRNLDYVKKNSKRVSIEHMFLLYRTFDSFYSHNNSFLFSVSFDKFEDLLTDDLYINFNKLIDSSYLDFKNASEAAGQTFEKRDYTKFIFNIFDLNNTTFIEVYEVLLIQKLCNLFNALQNNGRIFNHYNQTDNIYNLLNNYSDLHILTLDRTDREYLIYINYKFNPSKISFHQFIFIYINRLKDTSRLVLPSDSKTYLNYYGFYLSNSFLAEFYQNYEIKPDDYLNFNLAMQKYFEFYSNNI